MGKTIVGFMLVDAPHSALNNAGLEMTERAENIVRVKTIRRGKNLFPYVSGQALRYWWRNTLNLKCDWKLSPLEKIEKKNQVFTAANPVEYDDDDIFGYMRALKKETVTRLSPLKNSPLVSIVSQKPTEDFGVSARHEGDPVRYDHEFYSTVLKGIFSLDLDSVGVFYSVEKTGYKNMYPELEETAKKNGAKKGKDGKWVMPKKIREKRAKEVIQVLPHLSGGAKQTSHLTDVSPKFLVLAAIDGGNHIFMNIAKEEKGEGLISFEALDEVIRDYSDVLLTDIYIGKRKGFMDELESEIQKMAEKYKKQKRKVIFGTVNEIAEKFSEKIPELMG